VFRASVAKCLTVSTVLCAIVLAGCAGESAQRESKTGRVRVAATVDRQLEPRIRRTNPELLAPLPAPECDFTGAGANTVDADQFARLKLDYERGCYKDAEKLARDRLRLLQTLIHRSG